MPATGAAACRTATALPAAGCAIGAAANTPAAAAPADRPRPVNAPATTPTANAGDTAPAAAPAAAPGEPDAPGLDETAGLDGELGDEDEDGLGEALGGTEALGDALPDADPLGVAAAADGLGEAAAPDGDGDAAGGATVPAAAAAFARAARIASAFCDVGGTCGRYRNPLPVDGTAAGAWEKSGPGEAGADGAATPCGSALINATRCRPVGSFVVGTGVPTRHAATSGVVNAHAGYAYTCSRRPYPPPNASAIPE
jgi:hypothetical protein